jgi:hypothetical protein
MPDEKQLALPGSSWDTVKKIIRAFYAAQSEENPKLEGIARLAAVPRPVVSMNNNFLRSVSIVRDDQWKLTDIGLRYATALQMGNESMAAETLATAARGNSLLNQLLQLLVARGEMKIDTFRAEVLLRLGISPSNRQAVFIKPVLDMLQESKIILMDSDTIKLENTNRGLGAGEVYKPPPPPPPHDEDTPPPLLTKGLPILLGPNRLAYLQLPKDWEKKDLPKLLKMLQLALGDDVE